MNENRKVVRIWKDVEKDTEEHRDLFQKIINDFYMAMSITPDRRDAYQATADMYVGIDVVRVNAMEYIIPLAKDEPLNLDDYKNWQLKQVADILGEFQ